MENLSSGTINILACIEGSTELLQSSPDYEISSPVPIKVQMGIKTGAFQPTGQSQKDPCTGCIIPAKEGFNVLWVHNDEQAIQSAPG